MLPMIEPTDRQIDVTELMNRVRVRAEGFGRFQTRFNLPALSAGEPLPTAILPAPVTPKTEQILAATQTARKATAVSRWIPKPLRGLFRRQGKFNDQIIRALESLANTNAQLADRLRHLAACAGVQDHGLHHLADLRRADRGWMNAAAQLANKIQHQVALRGQVIAIQRQISALEEQHASIVRDVHRLGQRANALKELQTRADQNAQDLARLQSQMTALSDHVGRVQHQHDRLAEQANLLQTQQDQFGVQVERVGAHLNNLQDQADNQGTHLHNLQKETDKTREQLANEETQLQRAATHLNNLQDQADNQGTHLHNLQRETQAVREQIARQETEIETSKARLHEIRQTFLRADERQILDGAFLKSELNLLDRRLAELSPAPARGPKRAPATLAQSNHDLDALYVAFEDQFRGSRELIKSRLQPYLKDVSKLKVITKKTPLLDLGCGRGEWLELLQNHGLASEGVDSNTVFTGQCVERGLRVNLGDAVAYLRSLPAASRGAITAFHLIEHLPYAVLVTLVKECLRVLRPGGLVIFETPNPDNLLVGGSRFYSDPTHLHPLPKEYPAFLLRMTGFAEVTTRPLNPDNDSLSEDSASPELRNLLNRLFYGDQDYAVMGRKSAA
jgi:SAM-dependent methyltransferase/predicted  nucleic acid-binding Zn-ribbon protein